MTPESNLEDTLKGERFFVIIHPVNHHEDSRKLNVMQMHLLEKPSL